MTVQILYNLQARLETISTNAQNLSSQMGKIRNLKYGIENQSRNFDEEIILTKTKIKIDIDNAIIELNARKDHII